MFPKLVKYLGYRHTYKLGCVLFGIASVLLPLSNRISGPISSDSHGDKGSGNGSGSGSGMGPVDDFCGSPSFEAENSTQRGDSVSAIPARVWAVLFSITILLIFSRCVVLFLDQC